MSRVSMPVVLMVFGVVAAFGIILLAWPRVASQEELWMEAAKAAMSAIAVGFFSVIIGFFVRSRDARRDEERQLLEYRRDFLRQVIDTYGRVKAVRRTLRAEGLGPRGPAALTAKHLEALDRELDELNDAELTFERLWREAGSQTAFTAGAELKEELESVKDYLKDIIREWEDSRSSLGAEAAPVVLVDWANYQSFLVSGRQPGSNFIQVSAAVNAVEELIWADILPNRTPFNPERPPKAPRRRPRPPRFGGMEVLY